LVVKNELFSVCIYRFRKILRFPRAANEPLGLRPASLIEAFIPVGVYVFFFRWLQEKTYI